MVVEPYGHSPGPLWEAGRKLKELSYKFWDVARYCEGKWLIGPLASPFFACGDKIREAADKFEDADQWLDNVSREINALGTTEAILDLITDVWTWFEAFLWDPANHVRYWIGNQIGLTPYEMQNWEFMIKAIAERYFSSLYHFWRFTLPAFETFFNDPQDSIRYWIGNQIGLTLYEMQNWEFMIKAIATKYFGTLYYFWYFTLPQFEGFFDNPPHVIKWWLYDRFPETKYIFDHPIEWVKALVAEAAGYPYTFWDDVTGNLWNNLRDYLEDTLEDKAAWLETIGDRILIYLW